MTRAALRRLGRCGFGRMSLRGRLLLIALALLAASLVAANAVAVTALERYQTARLDEQIQPLAEVLTAGRVPGPEPTAPEPPPDPRLVAQLHEIIGASYVAVLRADGELVQPAGLPPWLTPRAGPALGGVSAAEAAARAGQPWDAPGEGGSGRWRVVAQPLPAGSYPQGRADEYAGSVMVVAASRADVDATVARLRTIMLVVAAGLLAVLVVAGWFAIGAGLRPLRRIEQTAAGIAAGDLRRRVPPVGGARTEVGRLAAALNGMLGQLEAAFAARAESEARMRRFVADVSHELRTPLFGIHGFTELYRMGGLTRSGDLDRTMDRIERESARLARLTEDLLLLARLDEQAAGGAPPPQPALMDLRTLAADAYHDLSALDASRPVRLTGPEGGGPAGSAPVLADEARLRQVVSNLVGNVVAHTPPGTPVRIGVGTCGRDAVLELADQGAGMTGEQAARVFDRFYRVDGSRSRGRGGGAGLGLAIVRSLVAAHGGRVELVTAPGAGATFRVLLPEAGGRTW